ncbi:lactoylglutathione lyase [Marinobacter arenosus]|uniref:lactoylglutathione lyase n=1 Tax=Marinobacter arenosus TaxID=2856822 RepID=UPI001C4BE30F|nr:lactoylglutathione lyase [Marinobacter arenosus]MBW0147185.1 lactoylglutathione lyase [Marinobacter arenosus]
MSFTGEKYPGVKPPAKETEGFRLNHTMLRIKDPEKSLAFYTHLLGMTVLRRLDFEEMQFSLYFLTRLNEGQTAPEEEAIRTVWTFSQTGILELTHNWGTENEEDFSYHDGNAQPQGFGHICISVPDLDSAIDWFDANEVTYVKRPEEGTMPDVAFIKDVDGYWIEIIEAQRLGSLGD